MAHMELVVDREPPRTRDPRDEGRVIGITPLFKQAVFAYEQFAMHRLTDTYLQASARSLPEKLRLSLCGILRYTPKTCRPSPRS